MDSQRTQHSQQSADRSAGGVCGLHYTANFLVGSGAGEERLILLGVSDTYIYMYTYIHINVYIFFYIYICIYIHIHQYLLYKYISIYIEGERVREGTEMV